MAQKGSSAVHVPSQSQGSSASASASASASEKPPEQPSVEPEIAKLIKEILAESDFYKILRVERDADAATLSKSYKKLALKLHPDKCRADTASEAFKKISTAFHTLKDKQSRAHYDTFGSQADLSTFATGHRTPQDYDALFREMMREVVQDDVSVLHFSSGNASASGFNFTFNAQGGKGGPAFRRIEVPTLPEPLASLVGSIPGPVWILLILAFILYMVSWLFYTAAAMVRFFVANIIIFTMLYVVGNVLGIQNKCQAFMIIAFLGAMLEILGLYSVQH